MRLAEFIEKNNEKIADEWVEYACNNIEAAKGLKLEEVRDHVIEMLEGICVDMNTDQSVEEQEVKSKGNKEKQVGDDKAAKDHGAQRVDMGFDIVALSSEFRALRASVLRLWSREGQWTNTEEETQDIIRFNEAIDEAWMYSLERFHNKVDESKNWFLAVLGHDLRNPLAAILGAQQLLELSKNLSDKERKMVHRTAASAKRMSELISNLLELTNLRLGSGMSIEKSSGDFSKQAELIVQEFQVSYPNAEFQLELPGPVQGEWDLMRINQMMTNLIGNALRHGEPGGPIKVKVSGSANMVDFSVHNQGQPIPKPVQEKIFEGGFSNGNGNNSSSEESYGLGLYIVREVVERHEGKISLRSTPVEGTDFCVSLPRN